MKRHFSPLKRLLALTAMAAAVASPALATPSAAPEISTQALESDSQTCAAATRANERAGNIPKGLLGAIALAESGRWDGDSGEKFSWPWTVTTGGKGHFLPSRAAAQTFVYELQAKGVKNIDVGCMQINLMYHPDAFASVEEAFDPAVNTAYGATFLKARFDVTKSWILAAGAYHSTTPELNQKYRTKINRLWRETARLADPAPSATEPAPRQMTIVPDRNPDVALTARLNDNFLNRAHQTTKGRRTITAPDPGQVLRQRLGAWRETKTRTIGERHARNYSRVTTQQARLGLLTGNSARQARFIQARQDQLLAWREAYGPR